MLAGTREEFLVPLVPKGLWTLHYWLQYQQQTKFLIRPRVKASLMLVLWTSPTSERWRSYPVDLEKTDPIQKCCFKYQISNCIRKRMEKEGCDFHIRRVWRGSIWWLLVGIATPPRWSKESLQKRCSEVLLIRIGETRNFPFLSELQG